MESAIVEVATDNPPTANLEPPDPLSSAIQNHLILKEISKYISPIDMLNCRRSNHFWKNEWTSVIRGRSIFHLCLIDKSTMLAKDLRIELNKPLNSEWDEKAEEYFDSMKEKDGNSQAACLVQWVTKNVNNFPCSKITIGTQILKLVQGSVQSKFFREISNFVTELVLNVRYEDRPFCFQRLENFELGFCSVKALKIEYCSSIMQYCGSGKEHQAAIGRVLGKVLQRAPNFNTLKLVSHEFYDNGFFASCISAINNPEQIKTLHIIGVSRKHQLRQLEGTKLDLTELRILFQDYQNFPSEAFCSFLNNHSNSLKLLYVNYKGCQNCAITFPRMATLEQLELDCEWETVFAELNPQQSFPKLRHLKIVGDLIFRTFFNSQLNQSVRPLQTLEELHLKIRPLEPYDLENHNPFIEASRIFSNLKKLRVSCYEANMQALNAATWSSLQEVTLCKYWEFLLGSMNETLTGFSKMELALAEQTGIVEDMERGPYPFLLKVKTLRLEKAALTDLVCILGPMKLQSLQCLDLRIHHPDEKHQISEAMLESMRKKFSVLI